MESQHTPAEDTGAQWRAVTEALNALGDSIARASAAPVADDESRRRMRELSEGLASLAAKLNTASHANAQPAVAAPAAVQAPVATAPPSQAPISFEAAPIATSSEAPPSVRDAFLLATEKFRAAETADRAAVSPATIEAVTAAPSTPGLLPVEPVPETVTEPVSAEQVEAASLTGSFKAVIADRVSSIIGGVANRVGVQLSGSEGDENGQQPESSIQEWLYPEGLPEAELQLDSDLEPGPGVAEPVSSVPVEHESTSEHPSGSAAPVSPAPAASTAAAPSAVPPATAPAAQAPVASPAAAPSAASEPLSPEDVLRIAHERFKAERRSAVESANKAREFAAAHRKGKQPSEPAPPSDDNAPVW